VLGGELLLLRDLSVAVYDPAQERDERNDDRRDSHR
jgi:hypothetical protein